MNHAYLIMAHNEPEILKMLLNKLDHKNNTFFLHLDKRSDIDVDDIKGAVSKSKVHFIKRRHVYRGGYSQIKCEIDLLKQATKEKFDYYHLNTGVDLPIKSVEEINSFFEINKGKEFISFDKYANDNRNFVTRYNKYHFFAVYSGSSGIIRNIYRLCNVLLEYLSRFINSIIKNRSKKYNNLIFMKGSAYFDISDKLAHYILEQEKLIRKIFRFTSCCDEVFLHTLAYNSPYREKITFYGTRFIDWSKHGSSPEILNMSHYEQICNSKHLFARKFSYNKSLHLIETLNKNGSKNLLNK